MSLPASTAAIAMQRVPVVGRADHDRVDVLARRAAPVVGVARDAVVGLAGLLRVVAVDERLARPSRAGGRGRTPRRSAPASYFQMPGHVVHARDAADADRADVDAVARGLRAEHGRRHDRREAAAARTDDAPTPPAASCSALRREISRPLLLLMTPPPRRRAVTAAIILLREGPKAQRRPRRATKVHLERVPERPRARVRERECRIVVP